MKTNQIAAQLYTLRDYIQTPADVAATLKKVREIGYQAVQVSGMGPIDTDELVRILDSEGLTCCATHEPGPKILSEPAAVAERLSKLNCKYTAYPYPDEVPLGTLEDVKALAKSLDSAGKALREAGVVLAYHNHHVEFRRYDGKLMLEVLYDETDPKNLRGEIDTYWVQYGGGDSIAWCRRLKGRLPLLHLKDYVIMPDNNPCMTEVGNGNLNWPEIISAAEESGCEWFIVEQDTCPGDPFDSLRMSFEYLKTRCNI